jgi:hypothetical protein
MTLKSIIPVKDVRTYEGRFKVQLDIPEGSTLSEADIQKVLAVSSWDVYPPTVVDGFEGNRSVLVRRERPYHKKGMNFDRLQVSGIGHRGWEFSGMVNLVSDNADFFEPSDKNFMAQISDPAGFATKYFSGGKPKSTRPSYRATGCYTSTELREKVEGTKMIADLGLEKLIIPQVEAYGQYLDLGINTGNFGFIVLSSPDVPRAMEDLQRKLFALDFDNKSSDERWMLYVKETFFKLVPLVHGLRELHDEGYVHLQTHFSNFVTSVGETFLTDWGTCRKLDGVDVDDFANRVYDIKKPLDTVITLYDSLFPEIEFQVSKMNFMLDYFGWLLSVYSGTNLEMEKVVGATVNFTGESNPTFLDIGRVWLMSSGIGRS